jgi:hypothetical protein
VTVALGALIVGFALSGHSASRAARCRSPPTSALRTGGNRHTASSARRVVLGPRRRLRRSRCLAGGSAGARPGVLLKRHDAYFRRTRRP